MANINKVVDRFGDEYGINPSEHIQNADKVYWYTQSSPSGSYALDVMMLSLTSKDAELEAALAGKANISHTQAISTITGLQDVLDGKANVGQVVTPAGLEASLDDYQRKEDENLDTTDQSIVGAINEINQRIGDVIEVEDGQTIDIDSGTVIYGALYHVDNRTTQSGLESIVVGGSKAIHFHQGAEQLTADHYMVRLYDYGNDCFVEVAGAWGIHQ